MKKITLYTAAVSAIAVALLVSSAAYADNVNATLSATYFKVLNGSDADFGHDGVTPNVANGGGLGAHGLPTLTSPYGVTDVFGPDHELTWWDPALNANVTQTGTGTISLPYDNPNMYAPNSTGQNDDDAFETAVFKGDFSLTSQATVSFLLGSDDDSFIYVDGVLIGQNPGIHATTDVQFDASDLSAGMHSLEIFYADRQHTGAEFSLNLLSDEVVITAPPGGVPEPAAWALMITGFGLAGAGLRRRRATPAGA